MKMRLILGSGSPRRKELLSGLGFEFEIRTKDTPEDFPMDMQPELVPEYLALRKANALIPDLQAGEIVLCADTIVLLDGEIIGKPVDTADAFQMLRKLSGKTQQVITGYFIGDGIKHISGSDSSLVTFETVTDDEISYYIEKHSPFDKAGSYGVQEWMAYIAVSKIEGSYTNVMGLPTHSVYKSLKVLLVE